MIIRRDNIIRRVDKYILSAKSIKSSSKFNYIITIWFLCSNIPTICEIIYINFKGIVFSGLADATVLRFVPPFVEEGFVLLFLVVVALVVVFFVVEVTFLAAAFLVVVLVAFFAVAEDLLDAVLLVEVFLSVAEILLVTAFFVADVVLVFAVFLVEAFLEATETILSDFLI